VKNLASANDPPSLAPLAQQWCTGVPGTRSSFFPTIENLRTPGVLFIQVKIEAGRTRDVNPVTIKTLDRVCRSMNFNISDHTFWLC
jgi:hypothetical protein